MSNFLRYLSLLTVLLLVLSYLIITLLLKEDYPLILLPIFGYFFVLTAFTHHRLLKAKNKRPQRFVTEFMGLTGIKLFMSLLLVVAMSLIFEKYVLQLALTFLALYLVFTFFEVRWITREIRDKSPENGGHNEQTKGNL